MSVLQKKKKKSPIFLQTLENADIFMNSCSLNQIQVKNELNSFCFVLFYSWNSDDWECGGLCQDYTNTDS